ncbi:hypothetical protein SEA_VINCENZO_88 [Mycobacterium phage Vincenzo]|uniref:Uncharacterized protein n=2 Tax=Coopervirus vincenzo TaxID=1983110 RepID=A0A0F6WE16_9CAUD|nr:hypothetical protein SEA_VINCENZO_88 [Mycobacterium phage Vincenzo]AKF14350.1 hypothetical protein SEA_VINCENZO_88 [Mycobacterium phage Vincenzo]AKF14754.1 hypothetical protein SEA_ALANGRANT_89 [Mycobacterium phage AlanGrant]
MDPDAALAEMLDIARTDQSEYHDDIHRLCELVLGLHGFLSSGGFLPAAWAASRPDQAPTVTNGPAQLNALLPDHLVIPADQRCAGSRTRPRDTDDVTVSGPARQLFVQCAGCGGWYRPSLTGLVPDHRVVTRPPVVLDYLLPDSVPGVAVDD